MNALTGCLGFFLILILLVYAWPLLLILALIVMLIQYMDASAQVAQDAHLLDILKTN